MSRLYTLSATQYIPAAQAEVWDFVSSPRNLALIAPEYMQFRIVTPDLPVKMHAGMIIAYKVCPLFGIPMDWISEITHVTEGSYFVDEQRYGPYSFWHHQHFLREVDGGMEMRDLVHYKIPAGRMGDLLNRVLIRRRLSSIFDFRFRKIEERFGKFPAAKTAAF